MRRSARLPVVGLLACVAWLAGCSEAAPSGSAPEVKTLPDAKTVQDVKTPTVLPPAASAPRPHVVLFMADDLGWGDVGFHGSEIETPSIDALARTGVELSQFYVMPVCSPTRASLMTGRYPIRYGMQRGATHLPLTEPTLAERLRQVGYRTAIVGKWHLGRLRDAYKPTRRGFDHQYGLYTGATNYFTRVFRGTEEPNWFRDDEPLVEEGYATDLIADEAVRLVRAHDSAEPLFLWVSFNAPHTPLSAPRRYRERYPDLAPLPRLYAQVVTCMDDAIARVVAALEERGMREDTLIVFMSDNGPSRKAPGSAGDLRGRKHVVYEGGVRVPMLMDWRGALAPGGRVETPMHAVDLHPTLLRLAGAPIPDVPRLDGVDMWPTIAEGRPPPRRVLLYNVDETMGAIRRDDWKLVWHPGRIELFDLARDPEEARNLAKQKPALVRELVARLEEYRAESVPAVRGGKALLPEVDAEIRAQRARDDPS